MEILSKRRSIVSGVGWPFPNASRGMQLLRFEPVDVSCGRMAGRGQQGRKVAFRKRFGAVARHILVLEVGTEGMRGV